MLLDETAKHYISSMKLTSTMKPEWILGYAIEDEIDGNTISIAIIRCILHIAHHSKLRNLINKTLEHLRGKSDRIGEYIAEATKSKSSLSYIDKEILKMIDRLPIVDISVNNGDDLSDKLMYEFQIISTMNLLRHLEIDDEDISREILNTIYPH